MKSFGYVIAGMLFGFILIKSEVVSWFRIVEMFRFESFHMYGIIGSAILVGFLSNKLISLTKLKDSEGSPLAAKIKPLTFWRGYLIGGLIFGLGWAFTGACPGPLFSLVGAGNFIMLVPISSAIIGTYFYGLIRERLPH